MSIQANIPQIAALRKEVEGKLGRQLLTHVHFVALSDAIENVLREHVSPTTLERVWGYSTRHYDTVSHRTLDVLARYAGRGSWEEFCQWLGQKDGRESDFFTEGIMAVSSLSEGTRLRLGWQPDRVCEVRYLGSNRFIVESVTNGSLRAGDTFSCLQFQVGKPLYMDCFQREGEVSGENQRYAVGRENGLTMLEKTPPQPSHRGTNRPSPLPSPRVAMEIAPLMEHRLTFSQSSKDSIRHKGGE